MTQSITKWAFFFLVVSALACKKHERHEPLDITLDMFKLVSLTNEPIKLADYADKPLLVELWATWCKPCRNNMAHMQSLIDQYGDRINVVFISSESIEKIASFREKYGYTMFNFFKSTVPTTDYGAKSIPTLYLFDATGKYLSKHTGELDRVSSEALINELLGEAKNNH